MVDRYAEVQLPRLPYACFSVCVWIIALAVLLLSAPRVAASAVTYTYTGNDFTDFDGGVTCPSDCSVDGSFTVSSPLPDSMPLTSVSPTAFNFFVSTADTPAFTNLDGATIDNFMIETNSMGQIIDWKISLGLSGGLQLGTFLAGDSVVLGSEVGPPHTMLTAANMNNPGTWTTPLAPTPEPSSFALFLLGTLVIGTTIYRLCRVKNTTCRL